MKLSKKQKDVIMILRADDKKRILYEQGIKDNAFYTRTRGVQIISISTASALWRLKIIDVDGSVQKRQSSFSLSLTELGKTIKL